MNLVVQEYGDPANPALVFLHGLGVSSWMWVEQIEALQDRYYCLAIDLPGSGESYQVEWVSFADTAVQLANIIRDKTVNGQAHVIGLSLGGYTTLRLLADHPEVVLSALVSGVTIRPFPNQWAFKQLVRFMSRANRWNIVIDLMARMMQLPDEVKPLYRRDSKRLSPVTTKRIYGEVLNYTLPVPLHERPQPLLAVAGEKEAKLVLQSLTDFQALPTAVTAIAPNAHHGWNGEFPELFTEMIVAWIEQRPLPAALIVQQNDATLLAPAVVANN